MSQGILSYLVLTLGDFVLGDIIIGDFVLWDFVQKCFCPRGLCPKGFCHGGFGPKPIQGRWNDLRLAQADMILKGLIGRF